MEMDAQLSGAASQRSRANLVTHIVSFADACPLGECTAEHCPLNSLRKLNPGDRMQWLNSLSETDLIFLTAYHHVCMNLKLAWKPGRDDGFVQASPLAGSSPVPAGA
jgi:hypothetical protein